MIDPMVSVAFSVYSSKGVYALLLGSGISRAAGIPTGWEVTLDLVKMVAELEGEACEPDPADWFRKQHGEDPDYSKLLDTLAPSPVDRQQLLRSRFEPTEDEREEGIKMPTDAHKAIARLVGGGFLRVIITTNFDRLMERALEEVGITPTVISTANQLAGALPLAHSGATVIKLHGDYLDTRIKNTATELASYEDGLNKVLDRVLDEYGLIVCGWSGEWDAALRSAIERCPNRRFSTYWTTKESLKERGYQLSRQRQATLIEIESADQFFTSLEEKVQALADLTAPHPLSAKMAAATVKRYIVQPTAKIRLRDLVHEETERVYEVITGPDFTSEITHGHKEELFSRVTKYRSFCKTLLSIHITLGYWGTAEASGPIIASLQRIAKHGEFSDGYEYLQMIRKYPALLVMYGGGVAAVSTDNYMMLKAILMEAKVQNRQLATEPLCSDVYPQSVMDKDLLDKKYTPASIHMCEVLREPMREYLPREEDYLNAFDRFEYFLGLLHSNLRQKEWKPGWWGPFGCFTWRGGMWGASGRVPAQVELEIEEQGDNWSPLKAGLFNGSLQQARTAKTKFDEFLGQLNIH